MYNFFQISIKSKIILAIMLGVTATFPENRPSQFESIFNSSFSNQNGKLWQPIIIPNQTVLRQQLFSTTPRTNHPSIQNNRKSNEYFIRKIFNPDESIEALSQESKSELKYTERESKPGKNILKFSSKYSSKQESQETVEQNADSAEDKVESLEENRIKDISKGKDSDSMERDKEISRSDVIYKENKYEELSDHSNSLYPTQTHYEEEEDKKPEIEDYHNVNEPKETEESEVLPTTIEPYELQRPTSIRNAQHLDEESENSENLPAINEEENATDEEEEEDGNRSVDDYHDSGSRNYHSVQTPLVEIKFRGSHIPKDDFDYGKTRTRLSSIRRHPVTHNWPYTKSLLREKEETLNEIADSEEKDDSDEWQSEKVKEALDLERAVENDEIGRTRSEKNRYNHFSSKFRTQNNLGLLEEKNRGLPYHKIIGIYKPEEEQHRNIIPLVQYTAEPKININLKEELWSGKPNPKNLFNVPPNHSKQSSNFGEPQFLGPTDFTKNSENTKNGLIQKTFNYYAPQKEADRNIFSKDLTKKEFLDRQNLRNRNVIFGNSDQKLRSQSFDHEQENDELYNQILSNIQWVFGLRTGPRKSATSQKYLGGSNSELNFDENKIFTWAVPLKKTEKDSQDGDASKASDSKRDLETDLGKSPSPTEVSKS